MKQSYPSYRDSGIESLGELPSHWETSSLRRAATYTASSVDKKSDAEEIPVRLCNYTDVYYGDRIRADDGDFMVATATAQEIDRCGLHEGDVLITKDSEDWQDIAVPAIVEESAKDFVCGYHLGIVRPNRKADPGFLYRCLQSDGVNKQLQVAATGVTRYGLSNSSLEMALIPLPPLSEQVSIGEYLDREVVRIDSLIEKQHELIERLDEYRAALVTHTVTQGLRPAAATAAGIDPEPRMKASGVEWLGLIPAHWEVVDNRRLFRERDERSDDGDGELLTVSHITGVTRRSEKPDVGMFMAESLEGYKRCQAGDLIINTMWAWMGAAGTAVELGLVSPSYNIYTPDPNRLLPEFVDRAYRSRRYVLGMTSESRGIWSSRLRLYPQQFMSLRTAVPPLAEQAAIVTYLESAEARSFRLTTSARLAIERLREYRTALISAAVTGKIDVRDAMTQGTEGEA